MSNTRTFSATVAGMLVLVAGGPARGADKAIEWRADYDAARKEAADKARPLFLEFQTEDCYHCRRLEAGPFRDPAVIALVNERFVPLRIDANKSPRLTEALRIQAYPTMIIAAADGKILAFLEGYQDARPLHDHLQRALAVQTPDWMARDFQEASKAITAGEYAKAVSLLKNVLEDGKDRPVQTKAKAVLDEIEQQAAGRLVRVKQFQDKGQYTEAMDLLAELMSRYAGTQSAADGAKTLTTLAAHPELKSTQRDRRAKDLLAQAREAFAAEKYSRTLELCEILETGYKGTPEGKQGAELANSIRSSPEKLAVACEHLNERLAAMYATLGESWLKKGEKEQATACFEKAVRAAPASLTAREAQARLTSLSGKPPAITTQFQKPEK
jgi:tetratricopeptide (TPR) repeat protein